MIGQSERLNIDSITGVCIYSRSCHLHFTLSLPLSLPSLIVMYKNDDHSSYYCIYDNYNIKQYYEDGIILFLNVICSLSNKTIASHCPIIKRYS